MTARGPKQLFVGALLVPIWIAHLTAGKSSTSEYWNEWWTHDGISGPDYWGKFNKEWEVCAKGQFQSPVDLSPDKLLFDPSLTPLHMDKHKINGHLENIGHGIRLRPSDSGNLPLNITFLGDKANGYVYRFDEIRLHFGSAESKGSEHTINGKAFPGEIQIYAFNSDLYHNASQAESMPYGMLAIGVFLQLGEVSNQELARLIIKSEGTRYKGATSDINGFSVRELLPDTDSYITYSGSLTEPPCHESVTWVILNKPIYVSKSHLYSLRKIRRGADQSSRLMENNFRAPRPFGNHRSLRTNIDLVHSRGVRCPSMYQNFLYRAKEWDIV